MSEVELTIHPFRMGTDKEAAVKVLEEAAESFAEYQRMELFAEVFGTHATHYLSDELADCIQACCNLADRYGIDLQAAMERCEERNRKRGRYE